MPTSPRISPFQLTDLTAASLDDLADQVIWEAHEVSADGGRIRLSGLTITECRLAGWRASQVDAAGTRCSEVELRGWDVPAIAGPRLSLRRVKISESRLGALETYDAFLQETRFTNSKLGWVNLRESKLSDVAFEDCIIDELDLTGCTATRVSLTNCTINTLSLHNTKLTHVDLRGLSVETINGLDSLRGATISTEQVMTLAPLFAHHLGLRVE